MQFRFCIIFLSFVLFFSGVSRVIQQVVCLLVISSISPGQSLQVYSHFAGLIGLSEERGRLFSTANVCKRRMFWKLVCWQKFKMHLPKPLRSYGYQDRSQESFNTKYDIRGPLETYFYVFSLIYSIIFLGKIIHLEFLALMDRSASARQQERTCRGRDSCVQVVPATHSSSKLYICLREGKLVPNLRTRKSYFEGDGVMKANCPYSYFLNSSINLIFTKVCLSLH